MRSRFAVMPRTQRSRSTMHACSSMSMDWKRLKAMTGSNTLSWSWPASAAIVTVRSLPTTWWQTWVTTSGMTGFTLPGMMLEPGCMGGNEISPRPAGRALVVADLGELGRDPLEHARELDEHARVRRGLDEVGAGDERQAGDLRQAITDQRRVARVGVDARADGGGAQVDLAKEAGRLAQPFDVFTQRDAEGAELLAERHRHGVLELGPADLDDVGELVRLEQER